MTKQQERKAGEMFIRDVLMSFTYAYRQHQRGTSVDELLISHDIIAAGSDAPESMVRAHRCAVLQACDACDHHVSLEIGRDMLLLHLRKQLHEMLS